MDDEIYFPDTSSPGKSPSSKNQYYYVPFPYKKREGEDLERLGLAFKEDAFSKEQPIEELLKQGVVSYNRSMVVGFCDLKGSTHALRLLGPKAFRGIQEKFFGCCNTAVHAANEMDFSAYYPKKVSPNKNKEASVKAVIDKYMGDGMMFYVDCGNTPIPTESGKAATIMAMSIVKSIIDGFPAVDYAGKDLAGSNHHLGARFGLAFGDKILLSVIGASTSDENKALGTFSLTGEVVNLAARLEHATPSEFLAAIDAKRQQLDSFIGPITDRNLLRGSHLGMSYTLIDRQVINLYEVTEKKFEVRVDYNFKNTLETYKKMSLVWKELPFSPKGFFRNYISFLIGGNSSSEMFQIEPGGAT